jgi:hypothetical protein
LKVIISTCKKYERVCELVVNSLNEARLPLSIVTIAENTVIDFHDVENIRIENDNGWSFNMIKYLSEIDPDEPFLLWMDDLAIVNAPNATMLSLVEEYFKIEKIDALSVYMPAAYRVPEAFNNGYAPITSALSNKYPFSCMCTLTTARFMLKVLDKNESPWEFEHNMAAKLKSIGGRAELYILGFNLFNVTNIVIRGKVVTWRVNGRNKLKIKSMNWQEKLLHVAKISGSLIKNFSLSKFFKYFYG